LKKFFLGSVNTCLKNRIHSFLFIRLRLNTLQLVVAGAEIPPSGAAGMKGEVNRAEAHQSEGGLIPLYHFNVVMATAQFRFDTPQLVIAELRSRPAGLRGASSNRKWRYQN